MANAELIVEELPQRAIDAAAAFHSQHLGAANTLLCRDGTASLAIILPPAPYDHDDWRRTLARDLARAHAPKRVNVVAATRNETCDDMLAYLRDAPGVTGQYLAAHE